MRILLSGLSGTGSTTAAKRIAADFHLEYVYGGQIFRNLARERGISLEELAESLERHPDEEIEMDRLLCAAGRQDNVLIEGRTMGWIFPRDVPAIRIWLTCDLTERLRRVEDREHHARSAENLLRREASDNRRYKMLYGIEEAGYASSTRITLPGRMVSRARRTAGTARRTVCKRVSRTITTTTPTSAAATSF